MNDEKTAVINMVSEGTITSAEGVALLKALCDLEDMSCYESDVEVDDPKYLPPWESEGEELHELLGQNKCARAIASANQQIISALQEEKSGDMGKDMPSNASAKISALDVIQLSRCKPRQGANSGFTMGRFRLKRDDYGLHAQGWGFWLSWWMDTELEMPPTWGEPMLMQIFMVSRSLRLKWEADKKVTDEEQEQIKVVSSVESFGDSVITKAGRFDGCLKLRTVISGLGDAQFGGARKHDINDKLRRIGTQYVWLAPNVGIVKFLYEHPNNTQTEIELADYHVRDGEPVYFPLSSGNNWRYEWHDALTIHKELIRVFSCKEEGLFALSCSNHAAEIA